MNHHMTVLLPFIQSKEHLKLQFLKGRREGRGKAEGELCFVTFFKADNHLSLNTSHLLSHTLPLVQSQGGKNKALMEVQSILHCIVQGR